MNDYTIKSGDCLWDIAKRQYGNQLKNNDDIQKAVDKLAEANNIQDSDSIFAGNTITLPDYESIFGNNIGKDSSSGSMDTEDMPLAVAADENLYEKFNNWSTQASKDLYNAGLTQDASKQRAQYDEIEGRIFDFNKPDSENPKDYGVLELAEGQMTKYDSSKDGYIDLNEYIEGNAAEANSKSTDYTLDIDDETRQTLENSFNFFDFNHDNKLEINELKAYYNLVDSSDGKADGKFDYKQYVHWGQISSQEGETRATYKKMLDGKFAESYMEQ